MEDRVLSVDMEQFRVTEESNPHEIMTKHNALVDYLRKTLDEIDAHLQKEAKRVNGRLEGLHYRG